MFYSVQLLKGYTIEMFGEADDLAYVQEVERVAMQKGIQIRVHGIVNKDFLFKTACTAKARLL